MYEIDLNCDMGEGMNNDALLMPWISSANIACAFHAGDEYTMRTTIRLALAHDVSIGAHPGYADKTRFGRTEMHLTEDEVYDLVTTQIHTLQKIAAEEGAGLHHVKPHGALYNQSAREPLLAATIARAVYDADRTLVLYGLSGSVSITEAKKAGLVTANEVFADRTYQPDGSLTPRSETHALIENENDSISQVLQMLLRHSVTTPGGVEIPIQADTICIHGDGAGAVVFAESIYHALLSNQVNIKPFSH